MISLPPPPLLDPAGTALFLDLDGTLADIAPTPDAVGPVARRTRLLRDLSAALHGRLAVLTGRDLAQADRILERSVQPVAAVHGLVRRRADGKLIGASPSPALAEARRTLGELAASRAGLLLEDKGLSVALHFRQAPEAGPRVRAAARRLALSTGLTVQDGAMVTELRTPGPDKGHSLKAFLSEPPFLGCIPVMVGDDLTDENAFAAAESLAGYGVLVGPTRATRARYHLPSVAGVLDWLAQGIAA